MTRDTSSTTDHRRGQLLLERYRVEDRISDFEDERYVATQLSTHRKVTIKFFPLPESEAEVFRARFDAEANAAALIQHSNIVTVIDYGHTEDGEPFLVMEHLQGQTLAALLKAEETLPLLRSLNIAIQVGRAMRAAHGVGVIHRDLNPQNIMVLEGEDELDLIKVLNFGLVKLSDPFQPDRGEQPQESASICTFIGTPGYVAPEQFLSDNIDERADIYAFGVIFFEMLTGRRLFEESSPMAMLNAQAKTMAPQLGDLNEDSLPELQKIVDGTVTTIKSDRFESAEALMAALKSIWALEANETYGTEVRARSASHAGPVQAPVQAPVQGAMEGAVVGISIAAAPAPRRSRGLAFGAFGAFAVMVIGAGVLLGLQDRQASSDEPEPVVVQAVIKPPPPAPPSPPSSSSLMKPAKETSEDYKENPY